MECMPWFVAPKCCSASQLSLRRHRERLIRERVKLSKHLPRTMKEQYQSTYLYLSNKKTSSIKNPVLSIYYYTPDRN